jgi:hypothetical protein
VSGFVGPVPKKLIIKDQRKIMSRQFVHTLNEEYRSISGWYQFYKEEIVEQDGKRILFLLGEGEADSACCGSGGCRYALVPGEVINWKSSKDEEGRPISQVEPIMDPVIREEVRRHIRETEGIAQIQFW